MRRPSLLEMHALFSILRRYAGLFRFELITFRSLQIGRPSDTLSCLFVSIVTHPVPPCGCDPSGLFYFHTVFEDNNTPRVQNQKEMS